MTTERSDGATTTSGDLPRGADATMSTVRSDAETGTSRRRGAASIIAATKAGEIDAGLRHISATSGVTPPITDKSQRHRANYKSNGANK